MFWGGEYEFGKQYGKVERSTALVQVKGTLRTCTVAEHKFQAKNKSKQKKKKKIPFEKASCQALEGFLEA